MRKIGIIGGTSWSSTALYYQLINQGVARRLGGLHSAEMAIESHDLAPIAERQLAGDRIGVAHIVGDAARRLEEGGAKGILLASNTLHKVYDAVSAALTVPLLHIADATAARLSADGVKRAGVFGTRFTMSEDFFLGRIRESGTAIIGLEEARAIEVDRIVYEELAAGRVVRESQRTLKTYITELGKQKAQAIILGCTELGLAVDKRANVLPIYDTTELHARAAVDWMLGDEEAARAAA
jgi:aspartate racemase